MVWHPYSNNKLIVLLTPHSNAETIFMVLCALVMWNERTNGMEGDGEERDADNQMQMMEQHRNLKLKRRDKESENTNTEKKKQESKGENMIKSKWATARRRRKKTRKKANKIMLWIFWMASPLITCTHKIHKSINLLKSGACHTQMAREATALFVYFEYLLFVHRRRLCLLDLRFFQSHCIVRQCVRIKLFFFCLPILFVYWIHLELDHHQHQPCGILFFNLQINGG